MVYIYICCFITMYVHIGHLLVWSLLIFRHRISYFHWHPPKYGVRIFIKLVKYTFLVRIYSSYESDYISNKIGLVENRNYMYIFTPYVSHIGICRELRLLVKFLFQQKLNYIRTIYFQWLALPVSDMWQ